VCVVIDGAGSLYPLENDTVGRETSSIITLEYPNKLRVLFKNIVTSSDSKHLALDGIPKNCEIVVTSDLDIGKAYQSVSVYQGFDIYDCGKTMGWASYGKPNPNIPETFINGRANMELFTHNRSLTIPKTDSFQTQADLAFNIQSHTQQKALDLIKKAVSISGIKNIVLTGGYALNCTANYFIRKNLDADINLYVEPISHDGGTAIGAAKLIHHRVTNSNQVNLLPSLYLGPHQEIDLDNAISVSEKDIVDLLLDKNIVAIFQGNSEAGPRALGNRSLLFDPRVPNGKDIVNEIKRREVFRPFAASVLEEHAKEWFDLAGMDESPYMMYAVDVIISKQILIPAVVHVDGTCRVQTVGQKEYYFYKLIEEFYKKTGVPMLFNTSFNLAGEPLVETLEDAIDTLNRSNIEYLYLPEIKKLVHIPNK
jgi:carbamoyltransferase